MRHRRLKDSHVQLGLIFILLVLLPSFLLGYFALRAVDNERVVSRQRTHADRSRYAEFAARAVHQELESLEMVWAGLVPRGVGWDRDLGRMITALQQAEGQAFIRTSHLLHVSGGQLYPQSTASSLATADLVDVPDADEAERLQELLDAGEVAEFDDDAPEAAREAYTALLRSVRTPRLRAIAHAGIGRACMRLHEWQAAIVEFRRILDEYPDAYDLDNQPLRLQAWLHISRAREEMGQDLQAAEALVSLYENLVEHSDEIGHLQYDIFVERIEERLARLLPRPLPQVWKSVEARYLKVRGQKKKDVGSEYFAQKLSRKLIRASLDGLFYSTQVRYLSDSIDGKPFLLAYLYLPDASGTLVAGLVGFEIDLVEMSHALLPQVLQELELSPNVSLSLVDATGQNVVGEEDSLSNPDVVTANLGVPFDFWSLALHTHGQTESVRNLDFRTKVFLYLVLLLLVTLFVGAFAVVRGLRRESRLANLKTSFVSSVSHELRTPLTAIRMFSEILEESEERSSPTERKEYLQTIRRECDRLQRLIDQVLDFARSERRTRKYRFEFEEIGSLVRSVAEDFRAQAEADGFEYVVEIDPHLPELRVDRDAIRQMLLNLLANAVQYSETDRSITVRAFRESDRIGVQVEDRGIGIESHERDRIFEDFYRGDSRLSGRHGGVGLGLALVRRIAEAHHAQVQVSSQSGQGSTFTVWLPLSEPDDVTTSRVAEIETRGNEVPHG